MAQTIVLIDDDRVIQEAWAVAAREAEILIISYDSVNEFLKDEHLYQRDIQVFVDSDLGGLFGEVEAKKIFELNFKDITLLTSYHFDRVESLPKYIDKRISKAPPF